LRQQCALYNPPDFDFSRLIEQHIHPLIERDLLYSAMKGKQVAPEISAHFEQDYSGCLNCLKLGNLQPKTIGGFNSEVQLL
jgi:hypothetical protein